MKSLTLLTLSLFLVYVINTAFVNSESFKEYQPTKVHHYSSTLSPFRRLYGLSQNACVYQCSIRRKCKSLNYKRKSQTCELNDATGSVEVNKKEPSVYMERSDIKDNSCGCDDKHVCTDIQTRQCSIDECAPLTTVDDGTIFGNMNKIGSKLKVTCNSGYKEIEGRTYTTCLTTGNWQFIPKCVNMTYPAFPCPVDNTIFRTVGLEDNSLFTYKVYTTPASHADAASNCTADEAHLVRLTSSAKMNVLKQLIKTCPGYSLNVWIDLTNTKAVDFSDVNQWVSSVGTPLPTGNDFWHAGEPVDSNNCHCGQLWEGEIDDSYCSQLKPYICEKESAIV